MGYKTETLIAKHLVVSSEGQSIQSVEMVLPITWTVQDVSEITWTVENA